MDFVNKMSRLFVLMCVCVCECVCVCVCVCARVLVQVNGRKAVSKLCTATVPSVHFNSSLQFTAAHSNNSFPLHECLPVGS